MLAVGRGSMAKPPPDSPTGCVGDSGELGAKLSCLIDDGISRCIRLCKSGPSENTENVDVRGDVNGVVVRNRDFELSSEDVRRHCGDFHPYPIELKETINDGGAARIVRPYP